MGYLLYLIFRCDFDVMESLDVEVFFYLNTPLLLGDVLQAFSSIDTFASLLCVIVCRTWLAFVFSISKFSCCATDFY